MFPNSQSGNGGLNDEKQRQIYYLGMGLYGAVFVINLVFWYAYQYTSPHLESARFFAPAFTVIFTVTDSIFLRSICRKQFPDHPELREKWPIALTKYPTWPYFFYTFVSCVLSIYLLSRP